MILLSQLNSDFNGVDDIQQLSYYGGHHFQSPSNDGVVLNNNLGIMQTFEQESNSSWEIYKGETLWNT